MAWTALQPVENVREYVLILPYVMLNLTVMMGQMSRDKTIHCGALLVAYTMEVPVKPLTLRNRPINIPILNTVRCHDPRNISHSCHI